MDEATRRLAPLLAMQSGVVRRAQLLDLGFTSNDVRRMQRQRILTAVHPGVYVDHTGPLSWDQRSWAAVLACWPAALRGASAQRAVDLRARDGADDHREIEVVVEEGRSLRAPALVVPRRSRDLSAQVDWSTYPPRQRAEHWVLDLASDAPSELEAVAAIADAVGARRVGPEQLHAALAARSRIRRRSFLSAVIDDVAAGTCSVLEHGYLVRVERAHGLPSARRQVEDSTKGTLYRDVVYAAFGVIVELDGRLFHSRVADRDHDLDRDLDAAVHEQLTVRLGWGQVFERPCRTADRLGSVLANHGWDGVVRRCPECP